MLESMLMACEISRRRARRACHTPGVDITLRPVDRGASSPTSSRATGIAFGNTDDSEFAWATSLELDRTLAAFDGTTIVATAAAFSFELTVPGHALVPTAGVTMVGVHPTHRRRGLLVRMMEEQLADVAARAEPLAVLTACESAIYGRFGYGLATFSTFWTLRTEGTTFAHPSTAGGQFRLLDPATALTVVPALYDAARKRHVGEVTRSAKWFEHVFGERPERQRSPDRVHRGARIRRRPRRRVRARTGSRTPGRVGSPRTRSRSSICTESTTRSKPRCGSSSSTSTRRAREGHRPTDRRVPAVAARRSPPPPDHAGHRPPLGAGRRSRLPRSPRARTRSDDRIVIELTDPFLPGNEGRWSIDGTGDGAEVQRTDADADLALSAPELGGLYLGGVSATTLARCRPDRELVPGSRSRGPTASSTTTPRAVVPHRLLDQACARPSDLSWAIASMGPGSTSLSSAR